MKNSDLRIGYVPYNTDMSHPADIRRFAYYAKKSRINFELANFEKEYDILILTQAADLSVWSNYKSQKTKIIYDLIDSYLSINKTEIKGLLRGLAKFVTRKSKYLELNYWKSIRKMCLRSDVVLCTTEEQANYIKPYCDDVRIILDSQSSLIHKTKTDYSSKGVFNIVWEGVPGNLYPFQELKKVFIDLEKNHKIAIHFVTDLEYLHYSNRFGRRKSIDIVKDISSNVTVHEWNMESLSEIICSCDLAIIPIDLRNPLTRGKPENKLLLFWRMGMPVLTSSTPSYDSAMRRAGIDMTCGSKEEWSNKLEKCIVNEEYRRESGSLGKIFVDSEYSDTSILSRWDKLFIDLIEG